MARRRKRRAPASKLARLLSKRRLLARKHKLGLQLLRKREQLKRRLLSQTLASKRRLRTRVAEVIRA